MRADEPAASRGRILLIDDDRVFGIWAAQVLCKRGGHELKHVLDPAAGLRCVESEPWDLVITDIEMPDMDGFALAEAVRDMPAGAAVPIIALATMVSAEAIERGRAVGFHDFVAKFDRAGLVAAIKEQGADLNRAA